MNKKPIIILILTIFLISPIAYTTQSTTRQEQTKKTIIINGTINSKTQYIYINKANKYAGMEHWLTPLAIYDQNLNKIEDILETKIQKSTGKDIEIIVAAANRNLEAATKTFKELGGTILSIYEATASFRGIIPTNRIKLLAQKPEIGWIQTVHRDYIPFLRVSIPQQRIGTLDTKAVPPSSYPALSQTPWGQNIYGDPNTAIAVVDTGLDDSHPELGPYGGSSGSSWQTIQTFSGSVSGTGSSGSHYNSPNTAAWSEHQVYLTSGVQYKIILDWSTSEDLDLYVYKPGKAPSQDGSGDDYVVRAYTTNKPESVTFTADTSGYWVIAVDHYSASTSSTNYQITVQEYTESSSSGIDWSSKIIYWKDFTSDGRTEPADGNGHGSHCAGIAAGQGYSSDPYGAYAHRGVAPNAKLVGLAIFKMDGSFGAYDLYEVIQWLIDYAQTYHIVVSSNSWGGGDDAQLNEYMNRLVQSGVITVVAAGNSAYGANIGSPGSADLVITVGAVNDLNEMAEYSTSGDSSTGSTIKPDVTANGGSGWSANRYINSDDEDGNGYKGKIGSVDSNDAQNTPGSNNYVDWPGTSMATPHVAGLAALIIDAMGGWNSWDYSLQKALLVKMIILMTAVEFTRAENPSKVPAPPLNRGGKDNIEGYGRINADAAIMAVLNQLQVGQTYSYYLGSTDPNAQWYAPRAWAGYIYLQAGQEYTFTLNVPDGADFDLYIYNGEPDQYGQPILLESGTNTQLGEPETVTFTPSTSGKYYVVVKWIDRSNDGVSDTSNAGQFTLTIQTGSSSGGGESGGGESGGTGGETHVPPCTITGSVSGDGNTGSHYSNPSSSSWKEFMIELESGVEYKFTLDWDSSSDLDMYLYKPGTSPLQDGSGNDYVKRAYTTNKPEIITYTASVSGTFVVAVDHYSGSGSAAFQITVEIVSGGESGGGGGGEGGSFPITITGTVSGDGTTGAHYNNPSSPAWKQHEVTLTSGHTYRITLNWDSSSDLDLYLYKPGTAPGGDFYKRAYTTNKPEVIEFTADETGDWVVCVDHYSGSGSANYQITIELLSGGDGGSEPIIITGTVTGDGTSGPHFDSSSSPAWKQHTVSLQAGVQYRITLSWDSGSDLDLYLYKPGTAPGGDFYKRAYTLNKPEVIEFSSDVTGDWVVCVDHYSATGSANYQIKIEVVSLSNLASIGDQREKGAVLGVDTDNDGVPDNIEKQVPIYDSDNPWVPAIYPPIFVLIVSIALAFWRRRKEV